MIPSNEVQGQCFFLGVISKRPTLQVLSYRRFIHLQEGHEKLPLPGRNALWHNTLKLYNTESYRNLRVQETRGSIIKGIGLAITIS